MDMFRTIRWRLVLSYVLLTVLTVNVVGALATSLVRRQVKRQEAAHLQANAEAVARQALDLIWPAAREDELQELVQTAAFLSSARVRILDKERRVLADSGSHAEGEAVLWIVPSARWRVEVPGEDAQPVLVVVPTDRQHMMPIGYEDPLEVLESLSVEAPYTIVRRWEEMGGSRFRFHTFADLEHMPEMVEEEAAPPRSEQVTIVPIGAEAGLLGYVEISGGPDLSAPALQTTGRAFGLAAWGATLLAVGVGLAVSQGLSSPIRQLTAAADRMSGGDLSARASVRGRDEIGQLAGQFNEMAGRLEASFAELAAERDALRRFIADASHELRTPITALKNFNDLLQGAAADDPAARAEFLAESQVQIERLEWITRHLLDLSRLDAGLAALDRAEQDVGELIEGVASALRPVAREKGIDLATRFPEPGVSLRCDRARIELALSNVVENALKFTPAGGRVEVGAQRVEDAVRLWVRDTGIGIDPEDQPHIFERFYRGRNAQGEGSGLGLAIVHSVVQAHGGRVWVESRPGAGSTFAIELPER
jgi:signal transduction histidine kinase